jgi:hypothetical protein
MSEPAPSPALEPTTSVPVPNADPNPTPVAVPAADPTPAPAPEPAAADKPWIADDWRERIAGDDPKALQRLQRFPDVGSVFKSFREMEAKFSSGQVRQPLPENPTPEQIAEYRQANNIPEKFSDYQIELSDGLVIGEADRPLVDAVLERAHAVNASPEVVNAVLDEFFVIQEQRAQEAAQRVETDKANLIETLKGEWGGNFRAEMVAVHNLVQQAPDGLGDLILTARLADGSLLGNNIAATKWLAGVARELNPAGTVVPNAGGDQLGAIKDQIAEMEKEMSTNIRAWQHPSNNERRGQYGKLLEARDKLTARGH